MFDLTINEWENKDEEVDLGPKPFALIDAEFQVNDEGKKVKFCAGDLYYENGEYKIEDSQLDYHDGEGVGLFSDMPTIKGYTHLSFDEWRYVLQHYAKNHKILDDSDEEMDWPVSRIQGTTSRYCFILVPEGVDHELIGHNLTISEWNTLSEQYHLVAIPFGIMTYIDYSDKIRWQNEYWNYERGDLDWIKKADANYEDLYPSDKYVPPVKANIRPVKVL